MRRQLCTFWLGDLYLGIGVERIQEVLRSHRVTPVPLAPPAISGLINLRGQIVTAVDLRRRFGIPGEDRPEHPMHLILRGEAGSLSFVVDRVGDVVEVTDEDYEDPPDTLKGEARQLIRGAYKLEERLMLVIDTEHALDVPEVQTGGAR